MSMMNEFHFHCWLKLRSLMADQTIMNEVEEQVYSLLSGAPIKKHAKLSPLLKSGLSAEEVVDKLNAGENDDKTDRTIL